MEKIFDANVEAYLLETGISAVEIARIKFSKLKGLAIARLEQVISLIESDSFAEVSSLTAGSPSGDGWGCDNDYIDFGDITSDKENSTMDIKELCDTLKTLKAQGQL